MRLSCCLVGAGLVLLPTICLPQPAAPRRPLNYWLAAGLGMSSLGSLAGSAAISVQPGSLLVSARGTANSSQILGGKEYYDLGLLAGYVWHSRTIRLGLAAGCALVGGAEFQGSLFGLFEEQGEWVKKGPVPGIALEGQLQVVLSSFLGLGLYAYANLNDLEPFSGVTATLVLGRLR